MDQATEQTTETVKLPPDRANGHDFAYERGTDLFKCTYCETYEVSARDGNNGFIPCRGPVGYGDDTERMYLLLTENPAKPDGGAAWVSDQICATGLGRTVPFSYRDGRQLVETAPSVADRLLDKIHDISILGVRVFDWHTNAECLTYAEGQQVIANNYAAYVAKYGEPS